MLTEQQRRKCWENFNIWLFPANLLVLEAFQFSIKNFSSCKVWSEGRNEPVEGGREEGFN